MVRTVFLANIMRAVIMTSNLTQQRRMWVEFTIRVREKWYTHLFAQITSGDDVNRVISEHLTRSTKRGRSLDRPQYAASVHGSTVGTDFVDDYVTGYRSKFHQCDVFWIEDPTGGSECGFTVVGEKADFGGERFALQVYSDIIKALPRGYKIVSHTLRFGGVDHEFAVARENTLTPDIMASLMVVGIWTAVSRFFVIPQQYAEYYKGVGMNALFAGAIAIITLALRWFFAGRKVVYRGGK